MGWGRTPEAPATPSPVFSSHACLAKGRWRAVRGGGGSKAGWVGAAEMDARMGEEGGRVDTEGIRRHEAGVGPGTQAGELGLSHREIANRVPPGRRTRSSHAHWQHVVEKPFRVPVV